MTGYVDPAEFCADSRVLDLIAVLQEAVQNRDGGQLAGIVSPRGLYVAQHSDVSVFLTPNEVVNFFDDNTPHDWSRKDVGSSQVLTESLAENISIACNDNQDSLSLREVLYAVRIPGYEARNFYSIFRPGEPGFELEWGAWGLVIEYWDDQPVLMALGYYVWTP